MVEGGEVEGLVGMGMFSFYDGLFGNSSIAWMRKSCRKEAHT